MRTIRNAAIILFLYFFAFSCAKEPVSVGSGGADADMQKCLRISAKSNYDDAIQCFEMFKARYPKTQLGQEAELKIGDTYFAKKEYLLAAESYSAFTLLFPTHPKVDYAYYKAGLSYLKESPKAIDRDQGYLDNSIELFRTALKRYPGSAYAGIIRANLNVARQRIARRNFYVGRFYYRTGEYIACIPRFLEVAVDYPDSGLADHALYLVVRADIGLKRLEDAKSAFSELAMKYPHSNYTKKAEQRLLNAAKRAAKQGG